MRTINWPNICSNKKEYLDVIVDYERSRNGQIAVGTIRNYYKAIKLFADMNEIHLTWKKITKGLPRLLVTLQADRVS